MYPDFKELLSTLNAHGAKYLIVGGYAVGFHAEPRATKDLDILDQGLMNRTRARFDRSSGQVWRTASGILTAHDTGGPCPGDD